MSADEEVPTLAQLKEDVDGIKGQLDDIILKNRKLKHLINDLKYENNQLYDSIYNIEVNIGKVDQYSRRNNIELCNIPENIPQKNLEIYVLKVLESIGVNLNSYDLVAVHRVGKYLNNKNRNVIIRFLNRKNAYHCMRVGNNLKKSKNIEYKHLYITENLCPTNKKIFNYLYKLKKLTKINNVWSYNGSVYYQINDTDDENAERADHMDDLDYLIDELGLDNSNFSWS